MNLGKAIEWMPISWAIKELGVSYNRVYQLVNDGKLPGMRVKNTILVSRSAVQARAEYMRRVKK